MHRLYANIVPFCIKHLSSCRFGGVCVDTKGLLWMESQQYVFFHVWLTNIVSFISTSSNTNFYCIFAHTSFCLYCNSYSLGPCSHSVVGPVASALPGRYSMQAANQELHLSKVPGDCGAHCRLKNTVPEKLLISMRTFTLASLPPESPPDYPAYTTAWDYPWCTNLYMLPTS
jgi:hypothetical protein